MLTKKREFARFALSLLIIIGAISYWTFATITEGDPDAIWDIIIIAIVVSAGFVVFGEERFSEALGESKDVMDTDKAQPETESGQAQPETEPGQAQRKND